MVGATAACAGVVSVWARSTSRRRLVRYWVCLLWSWYVCFSYTTTHTCARAHTHTASLPLCLSASLARSLKDLKYIQTSRALVCLSVFASPIFLPDVRYAPSATLITKTKSAPSCSVLTSRKAGVAAVLTCATRFTPLAWPFPELGFGKLTRRCICCGTPNLLGLRAGAYNNVRSRLATINVV